MLNSGLGTEERPVLGPVLGVRRLAGACNNGPTIRSLYLRVHPKRLYTFVKRGNTNGAAALGYYYNVRRFSTNRVCISNVSIQSSPLRYGHHLTCLPSSPRLCSCVANVRCLSFVTSVFNMDTTRHTRHVQRCNSTFNLARSLTRSVKTCSRNVGRGLTVVTTLLRRPGLVLVSRPFIKLSPLTSRRLGARVGTFYTRNKTVFFSARILRITRGLYSQMTVLHGNRLIHRNTVRRIHNSSALRRIFLRLRSAKRTL